MPWCWKHNCNPRGCKSDCWQYWDMDDIRKEIKVQEKMGVLTDEPRLCKLCGEPTIKWRADLEAQRMNEDRIDEIFCARHTKIK